MVMGFPRDLAKAEGCRLSVLPMNGRIQINPNVCHGKPVIERTRIFVSTILGALSGGDAREDVIAEFPSLTLEDLAAALEFASGLSYSQLLPYEPLG